MTQNTYAFKACELVCEPVIDDRKVKAVIGRVDVVDRDGEMIVGQSFKIDRIRGSRWMHNSMPLAKQLGMVNEVEEPVGYGRGWLDGDKIIGEIDVMKGARGDAFLEHVRAAGDALGYSHGFEIKSREQRSDGVTLLHGAFTTEMSPVPDPASPGTGTLAALLGMKGLFGLKAELDAEIESMIRDVFLKMLADDKDAVVKALSGEIEITTEQVVSLELPESEPVISDESRAVLTLLQHRGSG